MQLGDTVRLRPEAAHGQRRELAGEVGRVGDVWRSRDGEHCTVVYETWQCLIWDAPASDFEPAPAGAAH